MPRRQVWINAAIVAVLMGMGVVIARHEVRMHRARFEMARWMQRERPPVIAPSPEETLYRQTLFEMLQPVALSNCQLERFGEKHDGGYLMCGNLLDGVQAAYSYGISGYDGWGCDISKRFKVPVHQYDCFNTTRPSCWRGNTVFHEECVGGTAGTREGRLFDTVKNQFAKNGDGAKRIVLKIDVEGDEWDTFLSMPDETLNQIDQLSVEFHWGDDKTAWLQDERYPRAVQRLKQFFEVGHIHFNNFGCVDTLAPFASYAYEVLFVSKRLAVIDPSRKAGGLQPQDAPNTPDLPDCQPPK